MLNILGILKTLNEGENYFIDVPNYKRIGNKIRDNFDLFERRDVIVPTPFKLIGHDERLNITVQNKIYGEVKMNPRQAKRVGLPNKITGSMEYKNKTIIKDGILNSEEMELIIDMRTYMTLKKEGLKFQELKNETSHPGIHVILNLTGMPITNNKIDYTLEEILNNINKINILKAKQKVLNALIKKLPKVEVKEFVGYSEAQTELLKDHGLNENLQYIGMDNEVEETKETYKGEIIEFKVKGSACSSFDVMLKRVEENNKLNALDTIQYKFYNELNENVKLMDIIEDEDLRIYYESELKKIQGELAYLRLRNTIIKLEFINSELKNVAMDKHGYSYKKLNISLKNKSFTK